VIYDEVSADDGKRTALHVTPHNAPFPTIYTAAPPVAVTPVYPTPVGNEKVGTIKFYNFAKGFGFIIPVDSPQTEIYVGKTSLDGDIGSQLHEGAVVTYELQHKDDKVWAKNVAIPGSKSNKRTREWDAGTQAGGPSQGFLNQISFTIN